MIEEETSFTSLDDDADDHISRVMSMRGDDMSDSAAANIRDEIIQVTRTEKANKINRFYNHLGQGLPDYLMQSDFDLDEKGRLFINVEDRTSNKRIRVQLTKDKDPSKFYAWGTLKSKIPVEVRRQLGLPEGGAALHKQAARLLSIGSAVPSGETVRELSVSALEVNDELNQLEQGETSFDLRELQGLDHALQTVRGDMLLNAAKLSELDKKIEKEKGKMVEADDDNLDESVKNKIQKRLTDLQVERSARIELLSESREKMRSQFARIKETVHRILNENTTLGERIRILFREQGITIASILTAVGMAISTLILAVTGGGGGGPDAGPGGGGGGGGDAGGGGGGDAGGGVKNWIKKGLQGLAQLLKQLAEKLAAALPGIIGSVFSWLFSTASKVVSWSANNLWSLFVVGLLALLKIVQPK